MVSLSSSMLWSFAYLCAICGGFFATLYALSRKDSKLKPSANRILHSILFMCMSLFLIVFAAILVETLQIEPSSQTDQIVDAVFFSAVISFSTSWAFLFAAFYKSHGRSYYFREKGIWKHTWPMKLFRYRSKADYEAAVEERKHVALPALPVGSEAIQTIRGGYSFLLLDDYTTDAYKFAVEILADGARRNETCTYVCVDKPPLRIWQEIKEADSQATTVGRCKKYCIVDSFTPIFGFEDRILIEETKVIAREGPYIVTARTMPGVHSAVTQGWKHFEGDLKKAGKRKRFPSRTVYDSLSVLKDFATVEEISSFFHHMIPAEKSFKMVTVIIESKEADKGILQTLRELVDCILEFKRDGDRTIVIPRKMRGVNAVSLDTEYEWVTDVV